MIAMVVPCFNEADRFDPEAFARYQPDRDVRFLFVDDGSTDGTREVLQSLVRQDQDRYSLLEMEENRGKAEAVRRGILKIMSDTPRYFGYWDADLSTPLDEICRFARKLEQRSERRMIFGSRVNMLGWSIRRNELRHYIGRGYATAISHVLDLPIYDSQCGAKLFSGGDELYELFEEPFQSDWLFDVELIARWKKRRSRDGRAPPEEVIYECPVRQWHEKGTSKVRAIDGIRAIWNLVEIYRSLHPS